MVLLFAPVVLSQGTQIPAQRSQVNSWFASIIKPAKERARTLDPDVAKAEANPKIIKVKKGGGGDFDTITQSHRETLLHTLTGKCKGAQAVALRVAGDRSAIYNCNLYGFQDTLCDDRGNHFYKNCNIRGTVDFIFGRGKSIYLDSDLYVVPDPRLTVITAQARESSSEDTGYSFVHGKVYGPAKGAFLGRAWRSSPRVVFAYSDMGKVVNPAGWSHNNQPDRAKTVYYGEYKCIGKAQVQCSPSVEQGSNATEQGSNATEPTM
ncbi:hypothetical protein V6N11_057460 [Hibiscus sabdariffa]|uniref:Pectinesterase n=1 Tax=Hibiscus sabdariffa TaxID=183260 RepID=A0ABR2NGR9_9ROSI